MADGSECGLRLTAELVVGGSFEWNGWKESL